MNGSYEEQTDSYGPYTVPGSGSYQGNGSERVGRPTTESLTKSRPQILIAGLPGSGKSSVQSVVFHKISPHETVFLAATESVHKHEVGNSAFVQLQILDIPGKLGSVEAEENLDSVMKGCSALIFVIDVTSENTDEALSRLKDTILRAYNANSNIFIEVFIHKADALTEEQRRYCQSELQERVDDELRESNDKVINRISYRTTSIFDHSVFEAFSLVVQRLISELGALESMLDLLVNRCIMEKAFLFDEVSKLYIATDSTPYHPQDFELCSDLIEVNIDLGGIYSEKIAKKGATDKDEDDKSTKGRSSSATIHLSNNMILYLREVSQYLLLVCIMRRQNFDGNVGLIEYNVKIFAEGLREIIERRRQELNLPSES
uniref:Ras-related GTP-binding protein n=2 Tax=Rhodosorus marinus TaxID=101924 RepID=A0A7S2ZL07_9RHOD|mmetsp:Transcript_23454/g.93067  ORF Transcript_23454/g.93067 Transcript_23454/m.93067 type:complete len:375 (+) Transcript_23454:93-1217(+)|eukprot:CAMPEP_0113966270 /NCGR_PEP_ID=MMETSP0011_2-20120614/8236_1 /TAXON_ID=101924 /ORGANISM="Rhodosorus marinus" /LENGTH=374 /DNA_ID=CAMNT_0000978933 /DNA_START=40 /DNA_END=1164 /DNA_ORIENTATION=+ /assembly_acc=CAM_ASM_000156